MNPEIIEYIKQARKLKASNEDIESMLLAAGWPADQVRAALHANLELPVPPPPPHELAEAPTPNPQAPVMPVHPVGPAPVAVVQSMSTRGFEYIIMFIALYITSSSLGALLHNFVNNAFVEVSSSPYSSYSSNDGSLVSYASAALIVALPIFCWLFLRLKKAELADPTLKADPSRRKAVHLTLVITFLIGVFKVIGYIFSLMNSTSSDSYSLFSIFGFFDGSRGSGSAIANLLHTLITLIIAGGIFWYYWNDQHHKA